MPTTIDKSRTHLDAHPIPEAKAEPASTPPPEPAPSGLVTAVRRALCDLSDAQRTEGQRIIGAVGDVRDRLRAALAAESVGRG